MCTHLCDCPQTWWKAFFTSSFVKYFPFPMCGKKSSIVGNGWFSRSTASLARRMSTQTRMSSVFGTGTIGENHSDGSFTYFCFTNNILCVSIYKVRLTLFIFKFFSFSVRLFLDAIVHQFSFQQQTQVAPECDDMAVLQVSLPCLSVFLRRTLLFCSFDWLQLG